MPDKSGTGLLLQKLWQWFIAPSPEIVQPDQRRQASLLTGFVLASTVLAVVMEAITALYIEWSNYTGYRQTMISVTLLIVVYFISRTQHLQMAAMLTVAVASFAVFMTGWGEPRGVLSGLFDFLIVPLWLGSLFIDLKKLSFLIVSVLFGLLIFPIVTPSVTFNDIIVGPFVFVGITSVLLLVITSYRNRLEQDRQAELLVKENRNRREAARADALLRAAARLNAQLDQDTILVAIGEEASRALSTPISIVMLYDQASNKLHAAGGVGLPPEFLKTLPPLSMASYEEIVKVLGEVFSMPDLQSTPYGRYLDFFKTGNLRSVAFAAMEYEHELIGCLSVSTLGEVRNFTRDELVLLQGLADQAALALVNTRLYNDAHRRLEQLQALRTIDTAIATQRDLQENLAVLLDKITEQLKVDSAVFLLLNEANQQLELATSLGFHAVNLTFKHLRLGEGMAGRAALERKIVYTQDLRVDPKTLLNAPILAQEGFVSYYAAPMVAQGKVKGVLEIFHRSLLNPDDEWFSFLEALTEQAAIAIESTTLFQDLQRANDELSQAYDSTIEGWSRALDLRDRETEGHTQRVTRMTLKLARAIGFTEPELIHIRRGALLHDIGKMGVPDGILLKPAALTVEEWVMMRQHPQFAYDMLAPIEYLKPALDIPYYHHEKWDGSGYPRGLKGEDIPLAARIFTVADVYDALTSDRPYRKAWTREKTLEHIRVLSGTHFDPQAVDLMMRLMDEEEDDTFSI
jgi:HD-GYP domain-containing protein (c-di-GMP phosphodiesterase class II)